MVGIVDRGESGVWVRKRWTRYFIVRVRRIFYSEISRYYRLVQMKRSLLFLGSIAFGLSSEACSVCMGASGLTAEATNNAIFFMLGTLFLVFGGIVAAGVSIVRRSRMALPVCIELNSLVK